MLGCWMMGPRDQNKFQRNSYIHDNIDRRASLYDSLGRQPIQRNFKSRYEHISRGWAKSQFLRHRACKVMCKILVHSRLTLLAHVWTNLIKQFIWFQLSAVFSLSASSAAKTARKSPVRRRRDHYIQRYGPDCQNTNKYVWEGAKLVHRLSTLWLPPDQGDR